MPGLATREPRLTMPPGGVPGAAVEERNDASAQRRERLETGLRSLGIASVRVSSSATAIGSLFRLLERHRRARR